MALFRINLWVVYRPQSVIPGSPAKVSVAAKVTVPAQQYVLTLSANNDHTTHTKMATRRQPITNVSCPCIPLLRKFLSLLTQQQRIKFVEGYSIRETTYSAQIVPEVLKVAFLVEAALH